MKIIIPGLPASKKNSRIIIHRKRDGRHFQIPSEAYEKWHKRASVLVRQQWSSSAAIDEAVLLKVIFHTIDSRHWDLSNRLESIQDLLVDCGVLKDDDRFIVQEVYTSWKKSESEFTEIFIDCLYTSKQLSLV